jgi:fission process protein 1
MAGKDDSTTTGTTTGTDPSQVTSIERLRKEEPRPDYSQPLPRQKLPERLLEKLENDDTWWDTISSGSVPESTESNVRYAAYASRFRTILLSAHRYVAYTSDIGESFRPIAHPIAIRAAYGVSWAYLIGDVGNEGYKAYLRNQRTLKGEEESGTQTAATTTAGGENVQVGESRSLGVGMTAADNSVAKQQRQAEGGRVVPIEDYRAVMAQRAVFQGLASMGLPAFTIHSIVRYSGRALKNAANTRLRTWGPIGLGLAAVPALPYMFDGPVEIATEWVFHNAFRAIGGPDAVKHSPETGKMEMREAESKAGAAKEKEL